jgi:hypothetical protein
LKGLSSLNGCTLAFAHNFLSLTGYYHSNEVNKQTWFLVEGILAVADKVHSSLRNLKNKTECRTNNAIFHMKSQCGHPIPLTPRNDLSYLRLPVMYRVMSERKAKAPQITRESINWHLSIMIRNIYITSITLGPIHNTGMWNITALTMWIDSRAYNE